jgi:hypothetical protein
VFLTLRLDHHVGFPVPEAVYEPPPVRELHGVGVGVGGLLLGVLAGDVTSDAEKRPGRAAGAFFCGYRVAVRRGSPVGAEEPPGGSSATATASAPSRGMAVVPR